MGLGKWLQCWKWKSKCKGEKCHEKQKMQETRWQTLLNCAIHFWLVGNCNISFCIFCTYVCTLHSLLHISSFFPLCFSCSRRHRHTHIQSVYHLPYLKTFCWLQLHLRNAKQFNSADDFYNNASSKINNSNKWRQTSF